MDGTRHGTPQRRTGDNGAHRQHETGLMKAFRRLGLSSSPSSSKSSAGQQCSQSLPPYLAHLAGSQPQNNALSDMPRPHVQRFDRPEQTHQLQSPSQTRIPPVSSSSATQLPRPPDISSRYPPNLQPALVKMTGSQSQPYPWELVPQQRPLQAATVQRVQSSSLPSSPQPPTELIASKHGLSVLPVTPPRQSKTARQATPASPLSPTSAASFTKDLSDPLVPNQCWGIKQDGSRCTRKIRVGSSPAKSPSRSLQASRQRDRLHSPAKEKANVASVTFRSDDSTDNSFSRRASSAPRDFLEEVEELYCFQHVAEVNKTPGFYPSGNSNTAASRSLYIHFDDWFKTVELNKHTQALLRRCMSQQPSDVDRVERGYIYIYELRDRSNATHVCLKVGRTVNVFRRLGQWRSQCQSKDPLLRAFLPTSDHKKQGLLSGADAPDAPAVSHSHKWERLVHLELTDFGKRVDDHCQDCGSKHREIFMIPRHITTSQDGFQVTVRIVRKWLKFTQCLTRTQSESRVA